MLKRLKNRIENWLLDYLLNALTEKDCKECVNILNNTDVELDKQFSGEAKLILDTKLWNEIVRYIKVRSKQKMYRRVDMWSDDKMGEAYFSELDKDNTRFGRAMLYDLKIIEDIISKFKN